MEVPRGGTIPPMNLAGTILIASLVPLIAGCAGGALTVYEENDLFSVRGNRDGYYTQGLRVSRVFAPEDTPHLAKEIAQEFPLYDEEATTAIGFVFGQNIYTPRDITVEEAQDDDRPYAGWLYAGIVISNAKRNGVERAGDDNETVEVDVGVIGDPSLARQVQSRWHEIINEKKGRGWDNQLEFEPGIVATYERRHRWLAGDEAPLGGEWDVIPSYGGAVGNVDTHAGAGGTVRFGWNLPRDFGVNTISSTAMETTPRGVDERPSVYLFGGGEGRAVLRNIFLDGNTFRDSQSVDKHWGVAEARGGIAFQWKSVRLTYTWITRSSEFDGQGGWTRYGSLSLGVFLDF